MAKSHHFLIASFLFLPLAFSGCEDPTAPTATNDGSPKSTLGKAKASADRTVDQMQKRQDELSKQADSVFDGN